MTWTAYVQPGVRGWGTMRSIFDFRSPRRARDRFAIFDVEERACRVRRVPRPTVALPTTSRRYSPDASGQSRATADMRRATLSRATATWRHGAVSVYGSGGFARINADELMQVVDFQHKMHARLFSGDKFHALDANPPSPVATARLRFASVVDFPHLRGVRFFSGRSGVFPSIGGGFELQKVKSSAWARLRPLGLAWRGGVVK
jgi:hypothetical protein